MQAFASRSPAVVKSVQQRWLLTHWLRRRDTAKMPLAADFDLSQVEACRDDLSVLDVLPHNGVHRFRIFDHGRRVGAMYAGECAGKFLHDLLPDAVREWTLETYEHVVQSRAPVYTVAQTADCEGRPVLYERLLLPLADAEGRVVRILALLETISTEGKIEHWQLMTGGRAAPTVTVTAELCIP